MTTPIKTIGLALAVSAAGFFATAAVVTADEGHDKVKCHGVNSCKGQNDCKGESNACKGQGSCKGMGFLMMSADECTKAGGEVK